MAYEYGEVEVPVTAMINASNNATFVICQTPILPAGTYRFHGNYFLKGDSTVSFLNYHIDIGTNPSSIDTVPAGGSSNGHHVPIPGDSNLVTFCEPAGSRIITLDGTQRAYLRCITAWTPSSYQVKAGGALNWDKVPDLTP
jgi:hypothetical protein